MLNASVLRAVSLGMLAGAAGTIAMTGSQRLEMALSGREGSRVPGQVGASLLPGRDPNSPSDVQRLNAAVHWAHGIGMGALRAALTRGGLQGSRASVLHSALLWSGDAALYRALGIADVPWKWKSDELATDVLHKGVYAAVTGAIYDAFSAQARL